MKMNKNDLKSSLNQIKADDHMQTRLSAKLKSALKAHRLT
jgi:hypothetical protein